MGNGKAFHGLLNDRALTHSDPVVVGRFIAHGSTPHISAKFFLAFSDKIDVLDLPKGMMLYGMLAKNYRKWKTFSLLHYMPRIEANFKSNEKIHQKICEQLLVESTFAKSIAMDGAVSVSPSTTNNREIHVSYSEQLNIKDGVHIRDELKKEDKKKKKADKLQLKHRDLVDYHDMVFLINNCSPFQKKYHKMSKEVLNNEAKREASTKMMFPELLGTKVEFHYNIEVKSYTAKPGVNF